MGIENRNESPERPEQVEQFNELKSGKREELKKELDSSSDFTDVNSDKTDFSEALEDGMKKTEVERAEDMSDPDKSDDEVIDTNKSENPVEDKNLPKAEVETAAIDESNISEKIEASTSENSEQSSRDLTLENNLETYESDSENAVGNDGANTDQMSPESLYTRKDNTEYTDSSNLENNAKDSRDDDGIDAKSDEASTEKSNPERTPKWYDSLPEGQKESHQGLESIAKEYAGKGFLSDDDKAELSDKQYEYLKDRLQEDRNDCRIPTPESIKNVTENTDGTVRIEQNWKDGTDGAEFKSREMEIIKQGTVIDRIGSPDGKYFSPLSENGKPYSIEERATGDRLLESKIEENSSYHQYEVKQDLTRENIENAIISHYPSDVASDKIFDLNQYYNDCCNDTSVSHTGDKYSDKPVEETDGIKSGKIDNMFRNDDGGGRQYIMPYSASEMCRIGLIEEK